MSATARTIGNYTLGALIGHGGSSEVYEAVRVDGLRVALKLLRADLTSTPAALRAFVAEATQTRAIEHPNVVRVLDVGRDEVGRMFIAMEHVVGENLAVRLSRRRRLDEAAVRALGAAIADGASAAHALGIIHRDLKPANVMLGAGDHPKLVDFGIAKLLGSRDATGPRMGTPAYMAPEQLVGNVTTPYVDIWALGVILFELVTGELPFDCTDGQCPQLASGPPRPSALTDLSPELEAAILACLSREPGRRPASMAVVAALLRGEALLDERLTESFTDDNAALLDAEPTRLHVVERRASSAGQGTARRWIAPAAASAIAVTLAILLWNRGDASSHPSVRAADEVTARAEPAAGAPAPVALSMGGVEGPDREPTAAPTTLELELRSRPSGATIRIDGKVRGKTPSTLTLTPGASIELAMHGYRSQYARAERDGLVELGLVPVPRKRSARSGATKKPAGETLD